MKTDYDLLKTVVNKQIKTSSKQFKIEEVVGEPTFRITNLVNMKQTVVPVYAVNAVVKALEELLN